MNRRGTLPGLLATGSLVFICQAHAATVTTGVDSSNSAMGNVANGCLQLLTVSVSEGENCMYDGGMTAYEFPPGSGAFPANPIGESTGPFSQAQYYDYNTTPQSFDNLNPPNPNDTFLPLPGDGKIRQAISGSITIDDNNDGFGANDLISFTLTMTSPNGGDIVRNLGSNVADRYTSMTQVLAPRAADSVTPNATTGGFDYIIGTEGFPLLLTFTDASANETTPGANDGPCVGQTFGDMECDASFDIDPDCPAMIDKCWADPLRWTPWLPTDATTFFGNPTPPGQIDPPHTGPAQSPGLGTLEGNIGARTSGSVVNLTCKDDGSIPTGTSNTYCFAGKTSFNPAVNGPNDAPGGGVTAEDVDWDHVYLKVSTDADGNVLTAEGFDLQEYQVFGAALACGSDPGATIACNTWLAGHLNITGVAALDDTAETPIDTPVTIDVLANDTGFADPVTVSLPGGGTTANGGTAFINGTNPGPQAGIDITYTPGAGFSGTDTFDYTISDGTTTSTATVTVDVLFGATDDAAATRLNASITIPVGANDFGFTDPVTVIVTVPPNMGGSIDAINGSGGPAASVTIDYTPVAALGTSTYTETFTYEVTGAAMGTDTAVVTVTVNNEVPVAVAANASAGEGAQANTDVSALPGANLGDAPSVVAVTTDATNGVVSVTGAVLTYTPNGFYSGPDSYAYTISDADGETSTATVSVTIGPKLVPTAVPDTASVDQGDSINIAVTSNDVAGSGSLANHTVIVSSAPSNGAVSVGAGNVIIFTPDLEFSGQDSFQYTLTDLDNDSSTTTVAVTVDKTLISVPLPSGSAVGPWSIGLLLLPWLWRRRK